MEICGRIQILLFLTERRRKMKTREEKKK